MLEKYVTWLVRVTCPNETEHYKRVLVKETIVKLTQQGYVLLVMAFGACLYWWYTYLGS